MDKLRARIQRAGSPEAWTLERVMAAKVLLALMLGVLMVLVVMANPSALGFLLLVAAILIGCYVPDALIEHRGSARQLEIRREVSDTIDQLAVMVRAGLGIDAAIVRTARAGEGPLRHRHLRGVGLTVTP